MAKLCAYVDESGQDVPQSWKNIGFIVGGVSIPCQTQEALSSQLLQVEERIPSGWRKWSRAKDIAREPYIRGVLSIQELQGLLYYAVYTSGNDYELLTAKTAAEILMLHEGNKVKCAVYVDGMDKTVSQRFAVALRQKHGVLTGKVRGLKDESSPLIRLADALCGWVSEARGGNVLFNQLLDQAKKDGFVIELQA